MKKNFWKNKRVLITGANGFLGSSFLVALRNNGISVLGLDLQASRLNSVVKLNILEEKTLAAYCKKEKINLIIHCAALDGNAYFKQHNSARILSENVAMAANILNVAKEQKIKDLVIFSSAEIYSNNIKGAITESYDYTKYPLSLASSYATSKILIEIMAEAYAREFGLKILLPRPTNIYGPGDKITSGRVIPKMINKILTNQKIEIWGDGSQIRNFIYIDDAVTAVLSLIESKKVGAFNLATTESVTIKNLAKLITKLTGQRSSFKFTQSKLGGAKKRVLNVSKLHSMLNFTETKLVGGLTETIKYYQAKQL